MSDDPRLASEPSSPAEQMLAQRKAFETQVTLRAWSDPAFAEELGRDPVAAIKAAFGYELPAGLEIHVHREMEQTLHLGLPMMPVLAAEGDELIDDDLERVAGGGVSIATAVSVGITVSVSVMVSIDATKKL